MTLLYIQKERERERNREEVDKGKSGQIHGDERFDSRW